MCPRKWAQCGFNIPGNLPLSKVLKKKWLALNLSCFLLVSYLRLNERHRDTVLLDLLFSICYKFSTLSYIKMGGAPENGLSAD